MNFKFFLVALLSSALMLAFTLPTAQAGFFSSMGSSKPAPIDDDVFGEIDDEVNAGALTQAIMLCNTDETACLVEASREYHRAFKKAGYSLDKSLAQVAANKGSVINMQVTSWRDVYVYLLEAANNPKAAELLIKEGVFTKPTVDQVQKIMKELR